MAHVITTKLLYGFNDIFQLKMREILVVYARFVPMESSPVMM